LSTGGWRTLPNQFLIQKPRERVENRFEAGELGRTRPSQKQCDCVFGRATHRPVECTTSSGEAQENPTPVSRIVTPPQQFAPLEPVQGRRHRTWIEVKKLRELTSRDAGEFADAAQSKPLSSRDPQAPFHAPRKSGK
jgi:hypothetical protein